MRFLKKTDRGDGVECSFGCPAVKRRLIALTCLLAALAGGGIWMFGRKGTQTELTPEGREVLEAFERIQQAMVDKDMDTLYACVAADKTFTHMSGKTQTREEFFGEIGDGTLNYYDYRIDDPQIRISGDYACLSSTTTLTARVYGFSSSWPLRTEAWFQRVSDEWIYCNKPDRRS